jgi:hypothetical protein
MRCPPSVSQLVRISHQFLLCCCCCCFRCHGHVCCCCRGCVCCCCSCAPALLLLTRFFCCCGLCVCSWRLRLRFCCCVFPASALLRAVLPVATAAAAAAFAVDCRLCAGRRWENSLKSWGSKLIEWRWNSIAFFLDELMEVQGVLCECWSAEAFCRMPTALAADDHDIDDIAETKSVSSSRRLLTQISAAINSRFFWVYARMVLRLTSMLTQMSSWIAGCICHPPHSNQMRADRFAGLDWAGAGCPMKGRRAPEVAAGALHARLEAAASTAAAVMIAEVRGLGNADDASLTLQARRRN